jgi:hypothetical protein
MIESAQAPGNGVVAILARPAVYRDVEGRRPGRFNAIVTAVAGPADRAVIDLGNPGPAKGGVAQFTIVVRQNMIRRFAVACRAIVAVDAATGDVAVIETGVTPITCGMAVVALIIALNMVGRLAFHPHVVVAFLALMGRADKQSIDMAAIALHGSMTASQWETGGEMIEFAGCGSDYRNLQPHQHQQQPGEYVPNSASLTCDRIVFQLRVIHVFTPT